MENTRSERSPRIVSEASGDREADRLPVDLDRSRCFADKISWVSGECVSISVNSSAHADAAEEWRAHHRVTLRNNEGERE